MSNISNLGDAYNWSVAKIAEAFGLNRGTVKKRLLDANAPIAGMVRGSPVYALKDIAPLLFGSSAQADPDELHDPSKMAPKERKDWFDSEKGRIWLEKELRQLIPHGEVVSVYSCMVKSVVQALETLPDILERDAALPPSAVSLVQDSVDKLRHELAEKTYQASATMVSNIDAGETQ
ncbi:DUF1441 family protein [Serratia liquefaciens]|uniref:DUF1441 family protein n=1 Tax=Serratia liquefaciens TaxID=614 RepID=UPI0018E42772|nr:DUF1441 family protein [Serratia liquefaciens]MBI6162469.1 DUF1441 family protein [Serratia liquefaciens]